ncbi:unnamed protein product [Amoebophrya sp. A120]|nr:unnamed protein product [Amoebophrya sp. A120]|eukprot:GSA120T00009907001.1
MPRPKSFVSVAGSAVSLLATPVLVEATPTEDKYAFLEEYHDEVDEDALAFERAKMKQAGLKVPGVATGTGRTGSKGYKGGRRRKNRRNKSGRKNKKTDAGEGDVGAGQAAAGPAPAAQQEPASSSSAFVEKKAEEPSATAPKADVPAATADPPAANAVPGKEAASSSTAFLEKQDTPPAKEDATKMKSANSDGGQKPTEAEKTAEKEAVPATAAAAPAFLEKKDTPETADAEKMMPKKTPDVSAIGKPPVTSGGSGGWQKIEGATGENESAQAVETVPRSLLDVTQGSMDMSRGTGVPQQEGINVDTELNAAQQQTQKERELGSIAALTARMQAQVTGEQNEKASEEQANERMTAVGDRAVRPMLQQLEERLKLLDDAEQRTEEKIAAEHKEIHNEATAASVKATDSLQSVLAFLKQVGSQLDKDANALPVPNHQKENKKQGDELEIDENLFHRVQSAIDGSNLVVSDTVRDKEAMLMGKLTELHNNHVHLVEDEQKARGGEQESRRILQDPRTYFESATTALNMAIKHLEDKMGIQGGDTNHARKASNSIVPAATGARARAHLRDSIAPLPEPDDNAFGDHAEHNDGTGAASPLGAGINA